MSNPILIGQAEEIDMVLPQVRRALAAHGLYIGGDTQNPGMTVPLAVVDGKIYSMVLDTELDPERFLETATLHGPYTADQTVFDLVAHLKRQAAWSERTFGPGPLMEAVADHITKELAEVRESGGVLVEWVDVILLGLDGAWRSGATPEQVAAAILAKQTKNEGRSWPDWRTVPKDKAIEHDRSKDELPMESCDEHAPGGILNLAGGAA